jgi:zinc/manganese transport system substrate-binding protein
MKLFKLASAILLVATASVAHANLNIFACEPEWGALAKELGGRDVTVYTATRIIFRRGPR